MDLLTPSALRLHFFPATAWTSGSSRKKNIEQFFTGREAEQYLPADADPAVVAHLYLVDAERAPHGALQELLTAGAAALPADQTDGSHVGMFVFLTSRPLVHWDSPSPSELAKTADGVAGTGSGGHTLKENEFVVRVLMSHQIGRLVYVGEEGEHTRIRVELRRFLKRCPGFRDLREALSELVRDVQILREIAVDELTPKPLHVLAPRINSRELLESESLEAGERLSREVAYLDSVREAISTPTGFVDAIRRLYQLGRRPHPEAESSVTELSAFGGRGSFLYRRELDLLTQALGSPAPALLEFLGALQAGLRTYEILRDLSQWLAYGASYWARQMCALDRQPIAVLVVDEVLVRDASPDPVTPKLREDFIRRLNTIRRALRLNTPEGPQDAVRFDYVANERVWEHVQGQIRRREPLHVLPLPEEPNGPLPAGSPLLADFFAYRVILVEVEFREFYTGPAIVQKICTHLERTARDRLAGQPIPAVIVLSQSANFSHVQQSLNLGAQAFVRKERIYELPMRATQARLTHQMAEPKGQKSNFRSLYSLLHENIASLQSVSLDDIIMGDSEDLQERNWIQALPKADLHTHIGTFVDLDTISALAFNTVGRFLERRRNSQELLDDAMRLVDEICAIVALTAYLASDAGRQRATKGAPPGTPASIASLLTEAASELLPKDEAELAKSEGKKQKTGNPYETLVERLGRKYRKINAFEVTSLLVAVLALAHATTDANLLRSDTGQPPAPVAQWSNLAKLVAWLDTRTRAVRNPPPGTEGYVRWLDERMMRTEELLTDISDRISRLAAHARRSGTHGDASVARYPSAGASPQIQAITKSLTGKMQGINTDIELRRTVEKVSGRVAIAWSTLHERFSRVVAVLTESDRTISPPLSDSESGLRARIPEAWLIALSKRQWPSDGVRSSFAPPRLKDLVVVPDDAPSGKKDLLRYLWGTGLLGADHFQYPENLLLAALSVVDQSTSENIWYTELRCETVGYTLGGMEAIQATDLLCLGLDLAAAYEAWPDYPRSRFNVLLGAKRHKSRERFREIVSLTEFYMQTRVEELHHLPEFSWWKPCRVAGFDLSGDENAEQEKPRKLIRPLFEHSTPITIHAGEAASAESIWEAVYSYGARRIGHGLRLRENRRLMDYCISEGICMELCPISNSFTNDFPAASPDYRTDWWEYYPLRYYMEQGLDVCINTDNRQLHQAGTLTDEFLCAAKLAGGLTRWEMLRVVKMGFKHAFLPRRDIAELLHAVEDRVYEIITDPDVALKRPVRPARRIRGETAAARGQ